MTARTPGDPLYQRARLVAHVLPLDAHAELAAFFAGFMR
jgi:hypothetical protein